MNFKWGSLQLKILAAVKTTDVELSHRMFSNAPHQRINHTPHFSRDKKN